LGSQRSYLGTRAGGLLISLFALAALHGCSTSFDPEATSYVIMDSNKQETFLSDLDAVSRAHGLTTAIARIDMGGGSIMHVFEARGSLLRVWAQNGTLSAEECGNTAGAPSADPNEFVLAVSPRYSLPIRSRAKALFESIASELRAKGYSAEFIRPVCAKAELSGG
jgi:hypothetical protein